MHEIQYSALHFIVSLSRCLPAGRKKQALYRRSQAEARQLMALPHQAFKMLCSPNTTASVLQIPHALPEESRVKPNATSINLWGPIWPTQLLVLTALGVIQEWDVYNRVAIAYMGPGTTQSYFSLPSQMLLLSLQVLLGPQAPSLRLRVLQGSVPNNMTLFLSTVYFP